MESQWRTSAHRQRPDVAETDVGTTARSGHESRHVGRVAPLCISNFERKTLVDFILAVIAWTYTGPENSPSQSLEEGISWPAGS
jgi:hypothetical protein